jgi:hypothetical protein
MRYRREILLWLILGLTGAGLLLWSLPRLMAHLPPAWTTDRAEAELIALERLRDLGEMPADPYVVTRLRNDVQLERRIQLASSGTPLEALRESPPGRWQVSWEIAVYPPDGREWSHLAWIARDGEVLQLRRRGARSPVGAVEEAETAAELESYEKTSFDSAAYAERAAVHLRDQGFDLARFDSQPRIQRRGELPNSGETVVRFRDRQLVLGPGFPYGIEVYFEGEDAHGFAPFFDDPRRDELQKALRQSQLLSLLRMILIFILLPLVALPFLRLYHEGMVGVRRGLHLFAFCLAAALIYLFLEADILSTGANFGLTSRRQNTLLLATFAFIFQFLTMALFALMSWSVGEVLCRRRWPQKLASIDALFSLQWDNATFARACWRGGAAGLLMAGLLLALTVAVRPFDAWPVSTFLFGEATAGPWPGVARLLVGISALLPILLFVCLVVPAWAIGRFGRKLGFAIAFAAWAVLVAMPLVIPLEWGLAIWCLVALIPPLLFLAGDVLSSLMAGFTSVMVVMSAPALVSTAAPHIQAQGWLTVLLAFAPLCISLRHLLSDKEFVYRFDDVPAHVRRIAERERLRVELETARGIQSAILPDLPPAVAGIELAHAYSPATEVGGDFYDVLALADGRVAVAIGDVAGHGVSSGLVMSMAKSALEVQCSFNPEVEAVFATLNRMVYQSARRRLLSTLLYVLIDPRESTLVYASAGHVFPLRVLPDGKLETLESIAYPLGVRPKLDVRVRHARWEPGEALVLFSDGLVEACREGQDEPFGFDRLEDSLRRHAGKAATRLRDGVLADLRAYTHNAPQTDDLTLLVLRRPPASGALKAAAGSAS